MCNNKNFKINFTSSRSNSNYLIEGDKGEEKVQDKNTLRSVYMKVFDFLHFFTVFGSTARALGKQLKSTNRQDCSE